MGMLDGNIVIVAWAGTGAGREAALACARAGAAVVVGDLEGAAETAALVAAEGGTAFAVEGDLADFQAAGRLVAAAVDGFGGLHGVVNSGKAGPNRRTVNMTPDEFDDVLRVNLRSAFCTTRHAARWWREHARPGAIVNTTSASGLLGKLGEANDGAAKAAVAAYTVVTALELARYRVRVNALAPASCRVTGAADAGAQPDARGAARLHDRLHPAADLRSGPADPGGVGPGVVWLLSDAAAGISGQVFGITGRVLELYRGWAPVGGVATDDGWTPEGLAAAARDLVAGAPAPPAASWPPPGRPLPRDPAERPGDLTGAT